MDKKLYKVDEGKALCGVCAGLAEYLRMDVSLVRVLTVVLTVATSNFMYGVGAGLILTFIFWLIDRKRVKTA